MSATAYLQGKERVEGFLETMCVCSHACLQLKLGLQACPGADEVEFLELSPISLAAIFPGP